MNSSVNTRNNIAETETNDVSVGGGLSCKACPMPSEQESEKILFFFTGDITQEIHQANLYTKWKFWYNKRDFNIWTHIRGHI